MLRGSYKNRKNRKKGNIQGKYKVLMLRGSYKNRKNRKKETFSVNI